MARRKIANSALAVVVGPACRSRRAVILIGEAVLIHRLQENVLSILIVIHVVLFIGDNEVADALGDRVVGVRDFHFEGANGRMAGVGSAENVSEVGIA